MELIQQYMKVNHHNREAFSIQERINRIIRENNASRGKKRPITHFERTQRRLKNII